MNFPSDSISDVLAESQERPKILKHLPKKYIHNLKGAQSQCFVNNQLQPPTMPPIRTESSQKMANQEGRILLALSGIKDNRIKSLRAAAKLYDIPYRTLAARASGRAARVDKRLNGHKLTELEEDSLVRWIFSMDLRGTAPRPSTVRGIANILLAARGSTPH